MAKKKILFLYDDVGLEKPHSSRGFVETTNQLVKDADVLIGALEQMEFTITPEKISAFDSMSGHDLKDYSLVYFRAWAASKANTGICALYLNHHGIKYYDSEAITHRSFSKLDQYMRLWLAGLPVPATFQGLPQSILKVLGKAPFDFPVILKTNAGGRRGLDNYLAKDQAEAEKILSQPPEDGQFMAQAFIPNNCDYRILVFGGEAKLVIKRSRDTATTHVNNTSQGASAAIVPQSELGDKIIKEAIKAAAILKREIAGVDVVIDKTNGKHYFLEVNRKPQLNEGSFVEEKMKLFAEYIAKHA